MTSSNDKSPTPISGRVLPPLNPAGEPPDSLHSPSARYEGVHDEELSNLDALADQHGTNSGAPDEKTDDSKDKTPKMSVRLLVSSKNAGSLIGRGGLRNLIASL